MGGTSAVKLLLDTHIWLWSALDPSRLSRRVSGVLEDPHNEVWLSSISVWEALVLARKKRLHLEPTPEQWTRKALRELPVNEAPLTHEVAILSETITSGVIDPADRFLLATAMVYELTFVTADKSLIKSRQVPILANTGGSAPAAPSS